MGVNAILRDFIGSVGVDSPAKNSPPASVKDSPTADPQLPNTILLHVSPASATSDLEALTVVFWLAHNNGSPSSFV